MCDPGEGPAARVLRKRSAALAAAAALSCAAHGGGGGGNGGAARDDGGGGGGATHASGHAGPRALPFVVKQEQPRLHEALGLAVAAGHSLAGAAAEGGAAAATTAGGGGGGVGGGSTGLASAPAALQARAAGATQVALMSSTPCLYHTLLYCMCTKRKVSRDLRRVCCVCCPVRAPLARWTRAAARWSQRAMVRSTNES
jgi:hypothetical protein